MLAPAIIAVLVGTVAVSAQTTTLAFCGPNDPPGLCNYDRGPDAVDPKNPTGAKYSNQKVYIKDQHNYCMNLPDHSVLNKKTPTILESEGFVISTCVGDYIPEGGIPMPAGGIKSAVVTKETSPNGRHYMQMYGSLDCGALNIDCTGDSSGQIDSVPYEYFGKEPYSSVDQSQNPGMYSYVMQAGNGIYCFRVCQGGNGQNDPCNAKNDTAGCELTMGIKVFPPDGTFTFEDRTDATTTTTSMSSTSTSTTALPTTTVASMSLTEPPNMPWSASVTMPVTVSTVSTSSKSAAGKVVVSGIAAMLGLAAISLKFL
ncbi:hypothetical protein HK101_006017 [Irineochytrium annulatum]|nr:hypothetical protein HK101_006017 [Irineochytrium annulatum]